MARVKGYTDGAEMGDTAFWSACVNTSAQGSIKRSGSYAYMVQVSGSVGYATKDIAPALAEFYWRGAVYITGASDQFLLDFRYSANVMIRFRYITSTGALEVYRSTASLLGITTIPMLINTWYVLEVYLKVDDATGLLQVRVDGVPAFSFSGDTKEAGYTAVDNFILHGQITGKPNYVDDLALNDTTGVVDNSWCGDGRVEELVPDDNGDLSQFTNSDGDSVDNYSFVDDRPPDDDSSFIESTTSGHQDLVKLSAFDATGKTILRAWVELRAKDTAAGGGQVKPLLKSGGSIHQDGAQSLLGNYTRITGDDHPTNPVSGLGWTDGDLDDLQSGVEVV